MIFSEYATVWIYPVFIAEGKKKRKRLGGKWDLSGEDRRRRERMEKE